MNSVQFAHSYKNVKIAGVDAASNEELMLPRQARSKASIGQNNNNWRLKLVGNRVGTELDNGWCGIKIKLPTMRLAALSSGATRSTNNCSNSVNLKRKPACTAAAVCPLLGGWEDLTPSTTMESGAGLVQKSAWHCSMLHQWDAFATSLQAPRQQEAATGGVRPGTSEQCPEDNRSGSVCS